METKTLILACVLNAVAIAMLPAPLSIATCTLVLLAIEKRHRRARSLPLLTAHNMAVFLTAGKLDINPAAVVYALRGVINDADAVRLYEKYSAVIRQFAAVAFVLMLAGCSSADYHQARVDVAKAKAGATIEESRYSAEAQIEVKRLETSLEETKALYDYTLATQAQGLLVQSQQADAARAALTSMAVVSALALIALIVLVIGMIAVAFRFRSMAALPRPAQFLAEPDDDDLIIGLFDNPHQQRLLTKGKRK